MIDITNQNTINNNVDDNIETAASLVSNIIKKYNLKDFNEKLIEATEKGESFVIPGEVINGCAKKIVLSAATDTEAKELLKTSFTIEETVAKELLEDIKIKIVPIIRRSIDRQKNSPVTKATNASKDDDLSFVAPKGDAPFISGEPAEEKINFGGIPPAPISKKQTKKIQIPEPKKEETTLNKSDSYREPIE